MKRISGVIFIICFAFILSACNHGGIKQGEKYTMNASYSYVGNLEKTEVSYEIIIRGARKDIENIDAYEVLINMDYLNLMIENGPHKSEKKLWGNSQLKILGSFAFSTVGKSKEEVDMFKLLKGVEIIDKDNNKASFTF